MKTKIIPFDLETAKKIQAGEIEGKVYFKTELAGGSETYTFNLKAIHCINNPDPYYGLFECDGEECIQYIRPNGYIPEQLVTLIIEVPDNEPQFKPFDKVLVRGGRSTAIQENDIWVPAYFQHQEPARYEGDDEIYLASGMYWRECIPYAGNESLVGTTDKPKGD